MATSQSQLEGHDAVPLTQMAIARAQHAQLPGPAPTPWWRTHRWQRYLRDLLLVRGRRRYTLSLSEQHPLGATDTRRHLVLINPTQLDVPADAATVRRIRHLPPITITATSTATVATSRRDVFQQAVTVGLVEHEAGHIGHSGTRPSGATLGWLWNALEDERQERLQALAHPELYDLFTFLGDAVWYGTESTDRHLDGCLLWRWEHDRPAHERKFRPSTPEDLELWQGHVRPLVEQAWAADTSEQVTMIARQVLRLLDVPEDAPLPDHLPPSLCASGGGEAGRREVGPPPKIPPAAPAPPSGARIPGQIGQVGWGGAGSGSGHDPDHPAEADPEALLAEVEGAARDLARWLRPPTPHIRARPDPGRGELQMERALDGHPRPFDRKTGSAPAPSRAWLLLVDLSGSMGDARRTGQPLYGAVRAAMWLDRAAELAGVTLGILAFDDGERPIRVRSLAAGHDRLARRRIAGMESGGGTRLAPAFTAALALLRATPALHKLLVVLHDGDLNADDATHVRERMAPLPQLGIRLLPLYLGSDEAIVAANERVFGPVGHVLACPDVAGMTARLRAWLRASGA